MKAWAEELIRTVERLDARQAALRPIEPPPPSYEQALKALPQGVQEWVATYERAPESKTRGSEDILGQEGEREGNRT